MGEVIHEFELGGAVTLAGLLVVFSVLVILVFLCWLMGFLLQKGKKSKDNPKSSGGQPAKSKPMAAVSAPAAPVVEKGISNETVAAITAAISCILGPDKSFAVKGVKRAAPAVRGARNAWNSAGIVESTRPY